MIDDLKPQKKKPHKTRAELVKWWQSCVRAQKEDELIEQEYENECSMKWEMGDR